MGRLLAPLFITRHVLIALVVGGVGGVLFMTFLLEFDHYTSSNAFCTTCHSMTYADETYRQTVHYDSASGVRASCGDCHVSEGVFAATWDHAVGSKDLFKQLFGPDYDDPVINALHLPEAAFAARKWFQARDSATCMRCHTLEAIQGKRADTAAIHREETDGKSCIDCHYNLVHRKVPDESTFKREAWNRMVEEEFGLEPGTAERLMSAH
ncbi:NapC/NirT family cytochrome c [Thiocapsa roseopersicina]|uniref:Cytochrome c-type protein NapC/trimethylamine-N-oxide reductase (Cytochrome c), cytochrome c-type subunit TorC n=1 Tax=Thiocapsa roseopersicina TaxID=1058 RepID=A0A1H2Q6M4_THIRO|nr:NapC/NirT family cytochrome c [Thiocapsa roseopersicina]SDW02660.1 cytochrome c-type protein NapC/trimethylamine-N-oxide reductase (cytochrome c), cytochrome c-type subunit TorC [Thiocapsa roseopersicina]